MNHIKIHNEMKKIETDSERKSMSMKTIKSYP